MNEFEELVATYLDDTLNEAQQQRLAEYLEADPDLRKRFAQLVRDHRTLQVYLMDEPPAGLRPRSARALDFALPAESTNRERDERRVSPAAHFGRRWIPLAAAAVAIAGLGVFMILHGGPGGTAPAPVYAMGRLTKSIGQVKAWDRETAAGPATTVETMARSYCRMDQQDGTVIAVGAESQADWLQNRGSGAKTFNLSGGQAYLDIAKQDKPFVVTLGPDVQVDVLGTRLFLNKTDKPYVNVLQGGIRVRHGDSVVYVPAGRTVKPWSGTAGRIMRFLTVIDGSAGPEALAWLDPLGFDSRALASDAERSKTTFAGDGLIDFGTYSVLEGAWRMARDARGAVVVQENDKVNGNLVFGKPRWLKGEFSCKFKLLNAQGDSAVIEFLVCYNNLGLESFGSKRGSFPAKKTLGSIFNMRMAFEVDPPNNTLTIREMEMWPENNPALKWKRDGELVKSRANSSLKQRRPCSVGLSTIDCAAEFWDLKLKNAVGIDDFTVTKRDDSTEEKP